MIVRPMIGQWEPPAIERIEVVEGRRLARLPIPGLMGDLHQDLGADSLTVAIFGSLQGDERNLLKFPRPQQNARRVPTSACMSAHEPTDEGPGSGSIETIV